MTLNVGFRETEEWCQFYKAVMLLRRHNGRSHPQCLYSIVDNYSVN